MQTPEILRDFGLAFEYDEFDIQQLFRLKQGLDLSLARQRVEASAEPRSIEHFDLDSRLEILFSQLLREGGEGLNALDYGLIGGLAETFNLSLVSKLLKRCSLKHYERRFGIDNLK